MNDSWGHWSANTTITTGSTTTSSGYYINIPVTTTAQPVTWVQPTPSSGHIPAYDPPSLAEDELAWLRRRITEVTDLFPVAA